MIKITPWLRPIDYTCEVATLFTAGEATIKNGKILTLQMRSRAVITDKEKSLQTNDNAVEEWKKIKLDRARLSLTALVEDMLNHRRGFNGHKGYFQVVKWEPIDLDAKMVDK